MQSLQNVLVLQERENKSGGRERKEQAESWEQPASWLLCCVGQVRRGPMGGEGQDEQRVPWDSVSAPGGSAARACPGCCSLAAPPSSPCAGGGAEGAARAGVTLRTGARCRQWGAVVRCKPLRLLALLQQGLVQKNPSGSGPQHSARAFPEPSSTGELPACCYFCCFRCLPSPLRQWGHYSWALSGSSPVLLQACSISPESEEAGGGSAAAGGEQRGAELKERLFSCHPPTHEPQAPAT